MKFKNAIEIYIDNIVLLGSKDDYTLQGYDNKFLQKTNWCYLKQKPNNLFCSNRNIIKDSNDRDDLDKEIFKSGATIIDLKGEIYKELDRILRSNIDKFIEKNINNISYFFKNYDDDYKNISLFEMGIDLREKNLWSIDRNINILLDNFEYKDISKGILQISTRDGKSNFLFNINKMKFENEDMDIFKKIYGLTTLKKILAYEQYKKELTPPYYNEVAKINQFLEGKKSVTLVFNDGNEKQVSAQISKILATDYKEFWINTEIDNKNIDNLKAIRYGKKELEVNIDNLKSLDKQLDEIITNSNNNLEIEELENEC